jgi:hypothetical protein
LIAFEIALRTRGSFSGFRERLARLVGHERRNVALAIQVQVDERRRPFDKRRAACPAQLRDVGRRDARSPDVTRQERRDARASCGNSRSVTLSPGRLAAPIRIVARELDAIALA